MELYVPDTILITPFKYQFVLSIKQLFMVDIICILHDRYGQYYF